MQLYLNCVCTCVPYFYPDSSCYACPWFVWLLRYYLCLWLMSLRLLMVLFFIFVCHCNLHHICVRVCPRFVRSCLQSLFGMLCQSCWCLCLTSSCFTACVAILVCMFNVSLEHVSFPMCFLSWSCLICCYAIVLKCSDVCFDLTCTCFRGYDYACVCICAFAVWYVIMNTLRESSFDVLVCEYVHVYLVRFFLCSHYSFSSACVSGIDLIDRVPFPILSCSLNVLRSLLESFYFALHSGFPSRACITAAC